MPKIEKVFTLQVSPEQFLTACSDQELREVDLLIQSPRFANRLTIKVEEPESKKIEEKGS